MFFHPGAVVIDANENPLGTPATPRGKAIVDMAPQGGRYSLLAEGRIRQKTFTEMEGLKPEYVRVFPGSSEPLALLGALVHLAYERATSPPIPATKQVCAPPMFPAHALSKLR